MADMETPRADKGKGREVDEPVSEYSKRATLGFIAALGVTLLITGATGSRLLKRAIAKADTKQPAKSTLVLEETQSLPKPRPPRPSSSIPKSNPPARRATSRLKDLFAISAIEDASARSPAPFSSPGPSSPFQSLDFVSNRHLVKPPSSIARELQHPLKVALPEATMPDKVSQDPMMDAMVDAVKSFGLATVIVFGSTIGGTFLLFKYLGIDELSKFSPAFHRQIMGPIAESIQPMIPDYFRQAPNPDQEREAQHEEQEFDDWVKKGGWQEWLDSQLKSDSKDSGEEKQ